MVQLYEKGYGNNNYYLLINILNAKYFIYFFTLNIGKIQQSDICDVKQTG